MLRAVVGKAPFGPLRRAQGKLGAFGPAPFDSAQAGQGKPLPTGKGVIQVLVTLQ